MEIEKSTCSEVNQSMQSLILVQNILGRVRVNVTTHTVLILNILVL